MTNTHQLALFKWTAPRVRLSAAANSGMAAVALSFSLETELRMLLAYDSAICTYLVILVVRIANADGEATRDLAEKKETTNAMVLALAAILSGCSLGAVGLLLHRSKDWTPLLANTNLGLSLLAIFVSWTLLHVVFGIHYARMYYDPLPRAGEPADRRPLEFPDGEQPDFWDFMYFAFTLAVCYQVSDVTILSRHVRRVALAHMLLSFLNVTMILGLVVEIVSTLANPAARVP